MSRHPYPIHSASNLLPYSSYSINTPVAPRCVCSRKFATLLLQYWLLMVLTRLPPPLSGFISRRILHFILNQYYGHWIMGERGDVGRADSIVSGSERGGTFSFRNIDGSDLPPPYRALSLRHIGHFNDHTLSESSAYLYRVHCPPCQAQCNAVW